MRHNCLVKSCTAANSTIYCIELEPEFPDQVSFAAGQYLQIYLPGGEASAFSIASSPRRPERLELNILQIPEQASSQALFALLRSDKPISVELPLGDCYLPEDLSLHPEAPIILVAAGTGFAQMKSMLHEIFFRRLPNPVHLYWGNRQAAGFYHTELLQNWHTEHPNFFYHLVVSDAQESCQWLGREGLLYQTIQQDFARLDTCRLCISGSPTMVYATLDELEQHGLNPAHTYSDVFSYAPRDKNETK
ncbi:MAG: NAD(P)H-flavin reductase [Pseudomonadales bacterium]|nr:NAD(P)H-flavin reductase [Pseudomonadales bacterium]